MYVIQSKTYISQKKIQDTIVARKEQQKERKKDEKTLKTCV